MNRTYIQRHVVRTTRNLLIANAIVLLVSLLFVGSIIAVLTMMRKSQDESYARLDALSGSDVLGANDAADTSHPLALSDSEVTERRLSELQGKVITLNAPNAVNTMVPVAHWLERATGKKKPHSPPTYFVLQTSAEGPAGRGFPGGPPMGMTMPGMMSPMGGPALTIIPSDYIVPGQRAPKFTGVVRSLQATDQQAIDVVMRSHGVQTPALPYLLDCLNLGAKRATPTRVPKASSAGGFGFSGTFLVTFAALFGLTGWNLYKGIRRIKKPPPPSGIRPPRALRQPYRRRAPHRSRVSTRYPADTARGHHDQLAFGAVALECGCRPSRCYRLDLPTTTGETKAEHDPSLPDRFPHPHLLRSDGEGSRRPRPR